MAGLQRHHIRWLFLWPLIPFMAAFSLFVLLLMAPFALLSIPYYWIFPDHHLQFYDVEGTERQKELLARWREEHRKLGFIGRIRRAIKKSYRRFKTIY